MIGAVARGARTVRAGAVGEPADLGGFDETRAPEKSAAPDGIGAPGEFVEPDCALCGAKERRTRLRDGDHRIVECTRCSHVYATPRLTHAARMERVYDASYWRSPSPSTRGYADYASDEELHARTFARRLDALAAHLPTGGRALDVGCASGSFLRALAGRGFEVHGVEPSASITERALGVTTAIHVGTLDSAPHAERSFDLITLWDVLEHVDDPVGLLARARDLLAPGGRVVLETQDVRSFAARALGARWQHYKHDEHLHHFHADTLRAACARAGLVPVLVTRESAGKFVRPAFLIERSARIASFLPRLVAPFSRALPRMIYVNPLDEWIVVAVRAEDAVDAR